MDSPYLTLDEAAEYLRVNPKVLQRWAKKNKVRGGKAGARWRFKKSALDAYVEES